MTQFDPPKFWRWLIESEAVSRASATTYSGDVRRLAKFGELADYQDLQSLLSAYFEQGFKLTYARRIRSALRLYYLQPDVDVDEQQTVLGWLETNAKLFSKSERMLTVEDVERLIDAAATYSIATLKTRNVALIVFLYATGLRPENTVDVHINDFLDENRTLLKRSSDVNLMIESNASGSLYRVPVHPYTFLACVSWMVESSKLPTPELRGRFEMSPLWFTVALDGKRPSKQMSKRSIVRMLEVASKKAAISPPATPKDFHNLFLRQVGPGRATDLLTGNATNPPTLYSRRRDESWEAMRQTLVKVRRLRNLNKVLEKSRWQPQKPKNFTF